MITKQLVEQWAYKSGVDGYDVWDEHVPFRKDLVHMLELAAAHGAEQRDAELMGVGMTPAAYDTVGKRDYYTAEHLAAARSQGAEDERKRKTCPTCEALARTVMMDQTGKA